jgi:crotonobetaine/carnitine-CoA ligase
LTRFHDLLRSSAQRHAGRPAIRFDLVELTYEDVLGRAESLAAGLVAHGIDAHSHLAIVMDNSLPCVLAWLASSLIGCTEVPINPQYRGELLHYLLSDSGTTAVICDSHYLSQVFEVADRLPALTRVIVNGECPDARDGIILAGLADCDTGQSFEGRSDAAERVILYTSGTTGPSKGVIHTQKSCLVLARYNAAVLGYGTDDRLLNFFPLFHQNARYTGVIPAFCVGASIRIERKLSTSTFWQTCDRDGVTAFNYLGSVLRMILNVTGPERSAGTHTVAKAFGAGASPGTWTEFEQRLGIGLFETYGLSEAPMATLNVPGTMRSPVGSAGRASELFEVAIFDEADNPLPCEEVGEIVLRPRRADAMMAGYYNKDAATVQAVRNLWFHSGDRGCLTAQGDLFFEERSKDSIRRRGENISAWEVESVIEQHPAVAEAAVYGVPCADLDEEVAVCIVPMGETADLDDIHAFARERLPSYAVPTLMRIVADLPRTPTAKVRKQELRAVGREHHVARPSPGGRSALTGIEQPQGRIIQTKETE